MDHARFPRTLSRFTLAMRSTLSAQGHGHTLGHASVPRDRDRAARELLVFNTVSGLWHWAARITHTVGFPFPWSVSVGPIGF